jgi:hypothetical protein
MIDESDNAPTQGAREVFVLLGEQVSAVLRRLQELLDGEVAAFNDLIQESALPAIGTGRGVAGARPRHDARAESSHVDRETLDLAAHEHTAAREGA